MKEEKKHNENQVNRGCVFCSRFFWSVWLKLHQIRCLYVNQFRWIHEFIIISSRFKRLLTSKSYLRRRPLMKEARVADHLELAPLTVNNFRKIEKYNKMKSFQFLNTSLGIKRPCHTIGLSFGWLSIWLFWINSLIIHYLIQTMK